jgi:hypothetical protein
LSHGAASASYFSLGTHAIIFGVVMTGLIALNVCPIVFTSANFPCTATVVPRKRLAHASGTSRSTQGGRSSSRPDVSEIGRGVAAAPDLHRSERGD